MLPMILANIPAGAATKQLIHYSQEIKSGRSIIGSIFNVDVIQAYFQESSDSLIITWRISEFMVHIHLLNIIWKILSLLLPYAMAVMIGWLQRA